MELIFGALLGSTIMYMYTWYKDRVYKRKTRPLSYFRDVSDIALEALDKHVRSQGIVRITAREFRGDIPSHAMVNQSLVEIVNPGKLPAGYLGQFMEHLNQLSAGNAPIWVDRVTLAAVSTSIEVAVQHTTTDRCIILHFNPNRITGDLLGTYVNIFLGALAKK